MKYNGLHKGFGMSETNGKSTLDAVVMRLTPAVGDKFIGRPQLKYDLHFTVLGVGSTGVYVRTDKNGVDIRIPCKDWNRYVAEKVIVRDA